MNSPVQETIHFNIAISQVAIKTLRRSWGGQGFCLNFEGMEVPAAPDRDRRLLTVMSLMLCDVMLTPQQHDTPPLPFTPSLRGHATCWGLYFVLHFQCSLSLQTSGDNHVALSSNSVWLINYQVDLGLQRAQGAFRAFPLCRALAIRCEEPS